MYKTPNQIAKVKILGIYFVTRDWPLRSGSTIVQNFVRIQNPSDFWNYDYHKKLFEIQQACAHSNSKNTYLYQHKSTDQNIKNFTNFCAKLTAPLCYGIDRILCFSTVLKVHCFKDNVLRYPKINEFLKIVKDKSTNNIGPVGLLFTKVINTYIV